SLLPRREIEQPRRSRSESSTPSATPASSAATSLGTTITSCMPCSVGAARYGAGVAGVTVLYDEGCGFCTRLAARLSGVDGIATAPIGSATGSRLLRDLPAGDRYAAVHVVDPAGRRFSGGAALEPLFRLLPGGAPPAAFCRAAPGLCEWA